MIIIDEELIETLAVQMAEDAGSSWTSLVRLGQETVYDAENNAIGTQAFWLARARSAAARLRELTGVAAKRQCVHYSNHRCDCKPDRPLCYPPKIAAIYHGDIDGDLEP